MTSITDNRIDICETIKKDMELDASNFDGQPFTGKTAGTYMGYHGAAIAALAELIKSILEEKLPTTTPINSTSTNTDLKEKLASHFGYKSFSEMDTSDRSIADFILEKPE